MGNEPLKTAREDRDDLGAFSAFCARPPSFGFCPARFALPFCLVSFFLTFGLPDQGGLASKGPSERGFLQRGALPNTRRQIFDEDYQRLVQ